MGKNSVISIFLVVIGIGVGLTLLLPGPANHDPDSGQAPRTPEGILTSPITPPAFTLTRHDLMPFTPDSLRGKWSLMFFGYTHCPDVCPTTLTELAQAYSLLGEQDALKDIQFVFISVDPERDTPQRLAGYVSYFNEAFVGATGIPDEIKRLTQALGIRYEKAEPTETGYVVNHSSAVLLMDPQGRYYARFSAPHYSEVISQRVLDIRRYYESTHNATK